jgi:hypothetical protein
MICFNEDRRKNGGKRRAEKWRKGKQSGSCPNWLRAWVELSLITAEAALSVAIVALLGVVVISSTASFFVGDGWAVAVLVGDVVDDLSGRRRRRVSKISGSSD